jgi:beta-lactamase superfamily II metal-dependent hydrolase
MPEPHNTEIGDRRNQWQIVLADEDDLISLLLDGDISERYVEQLLCEKYGARNK